MFYNIKTLHELKKPLPNYTLADVNDHTERWIQLHKKCIAVQRYNFSEQKVTKLICTLMSTIWKMTPGPAKYRKPLYTQNLQAKYWNSRWKWSLNPIAHIKSMLSIKMDLTQGFKLDFDISCCEWNVETSVTNSVWRISIFIMSFIWEMDFDFNCNVNLKI